MSQFLQSKYGFGEKNPKYLTLILANCILTSHWRSWTAYCVIIFHLGFQNTARFYRQITVNFWREISVISYPYNLYQLVFCWRYPDWPIVWRFSTWTVKIGFTVKLPIVFDRKYPYIDHFLTILWPVYYAMIWYLNDFLHKIDLMKTLFDCFFQVDNFSHIR